LKPIILSNLGIQHLNPFYGVSKRRAHFDGFYKEYWVAEFGPSAGVLLVEPATRMPTVLLVRQYRFLIDRVAWELPGGGVAQSETPAETAIREVREETGYQINNPQLLTKFHLGLDIIDNPIFIFVANEFKKESQPCDPKEVLEMEWLPIGTCLDMVRQGEICDAGTMTALMYYYLWGQ